jgi:hypothetical protein
MIGSNGGHRPFCDAYGASNAADVFPLSGMNRTPLVHRGNDANDPDVWSGRALQEVFVELAVSGLASMYPVSDWSCFAPDHHGYQRACELINGQASTGHSGHQCSHAPGRPILHLYLSSRRPRRVKRVGYVIACPFNAFGDQTD